MGQKSIENFLMGIIEKLPGDVYATLSGVIARLRIF
jgi:hypothetical protein